MPKQIIKNVAQQIGQLTGEMGENIKRQPQEMAGKVLEQIGVAVAPAIEAPEINLAQRKAQNEAQSRQVASQISRQLEQEIEQRRQIREEQLRQRREASKSTIKSSEAPVIPTSKPSRRFGLWGKRIKSAQDQAQPETAGRRVGG